MNMTPTEILLISWTLLMLGSISIWELYNKLSKPRD